MLLFFLLTRPLPFSLFCFRFRYLLMIILFSRSWRVIFLFSFIVFTFYPLTSLTPSYTAAILYFIPPPPSSFLFPSSLFPPLFSPASSILLLPVLLSFFLCFPVPFSILLHSFLHFPPSFFDFLSPFLFLLSCLSLFMLSCIALFFHVLRGTQPTPLRSLPCFPSSWFRN